MDGGKTCKVVKVVTTVKAVSIIYNLVYKI